MSTTKKVYKIGRTRRLIDLNGPIVNFEIQFGIQSLNNVPFQATVVDQAMLDDGRELSYKLVNNGKLTGTLTHDDNVYQNFFLVLKADKECECEVELIKREVPYRPPPPQGQPQEGQPPSQPQGQKLEMKTGNPVNMIKNPNDYDWTKVLLTIVIIGGLCLAGYWFWNKYKDGETAPDLQMISASSVHEEPVPQVIPLSPASSVSSHRSVPPQVPPQVPPSVETNIEPPVINPILDKLKKLKLTS